MFIHAFTLLTCSTDLREAKPIWTGCFQVNGDAQRSSPDGYINPNLERKEKIARMAAERAQKQEEQRLDAVNLKQVLVDYLRVRALKPSTAYSYQILTKKYLADWLNMPVRAITRRMVEQRFFALSEQHKAQANNVMRILRALLTFAAYAYSDSSGKPLLSENPVKHLSFMRAWHRIRRRTTVIKPHQLAAWYRAVVDLENDAVRDYLLFLLCTGLRKSEAATLKWTDVDLLDKSFVVRETKNGDEHCLPLSEFLYELLLQRWQRRRNQFVFCSYGIKGHLTDCRADFQKVCAQSGVQFTLHDLRRTFLTIAESLDIPYYALKRLVNHRMAGDVTAGYIIQDVHRLRAPMEKISAQILQYCGVKHTPAEVVPILGTVVRDDDRSVEF